MESRAETQDVPPARDENVPLAESAVSRFLDALEDAAPHAEHHRIIRAAGQSESAAAMAAELNRIVQEILDAP